MYSPFMRTVTVSAASVGTPDRYAAKPFAAWPAGDSSDSASCSQHKNASNVRQVGTEQMSGVAIVNQLMFVFYLCVFGAVSGAGIFGATVTS